MKRGIDIIVSGLAVLLLLVPGLLLALAIKAESKGPVLFVQKRLGHKGKVFRMYKFRTMVHRERIPVSQTFPDDPEVTRMGRFLRRFKLDEIPQFVNVLKGDMSLIGPRPCLPELMEEFDANGYARLKVRPGLFGLADIHGGYSLSWPQRWVYDKQYTDKLSFTTDVALMLKAIPLIFFNRSFFQKKHP